MSGSTYSHVTDAMFDAELERILDTMSGGQLLAIPGIYEVVSEELNNAVLSTFDDDGLSEAAEDE
jgi:hypothetical protein